MSYPALSRKNAAAYVNGRRNGSLTEADLQVEQREHGAGAAYEDIIDTLDAVRKEWTSSARPSLKSGQDKDGLEGKLAILFHKGIKDLPAYVLTDMDFWRFCSAYLYDFVEWRNGDGCELRNYGAEGEGLNGRDCTAHRMFDRAGIAVAGGVRRVTETRTR